MKYVIRKGRVIDPSTGTDRIGELVIAGGKIEKEGAKSAKVTVIDAGGRIVIPGLIDMHVHLRQPGREDKETILTGTRAAVRGGVTSVLAMPNTEPPVDSAAAVVRRREIIERDAVANVFLSGAITRGREGKVLVDIQDLKKAGVLALSDDGSCVEDAGLMRAALAEAAHCGVLLIQHCENPILSERGLMNEGFIATKLGLRGIPPAAEYSMVQREVDLAREEGCRVHIAHVSCKESVQIIREAKRRGVAVTAETAPHYFTLTDEKCVTYDTRMKVNPPLRTAEDVAAIKEGIRDGVIDLIASDHAPHGKHDKEVVFEFAAFGMIGLETILALTMRELLAPGIITWSDLVRLLAVRPAEILGLPQKGTLRPGADADVTIIDPEKEWVYTESDVVSKSKNSPFLSERFRGRVTDVFVGGKPVLQEGEFV